MPTQPTYPAPGREPAYTPPRTTLDHRPPIAENVRLRSRRAERTRARLIGAHNRRGLAKWLRRTANRTQQPHRLARTPEQLLHYRAAAVRNDLLEIAAMLEQTHSPDPDCIAALRDLLANGCDSPLYNSDIHFSELRATLHYVRSGL